ncbi:MAG: phosphotransferase [Oligoflexia bacterium]|nr:phosphotransferase [Oligoflexia bacterium]
MIQDDILDRLKRFYHSAINPTCLDMSIDLQIKKLFGDASHREYYRISQKSTGSEVTHVICVERGEIENLLDYDFYLVQDLLKKHNIPVPEILAINQKEGLLLEEDLGDLSLLKFLYRINNYEEEFNVYKKCLDVLIKIHSISTAPNSQYEYIFSRSFDQEKYTYEFNHTNKYFLKHLLDAKIENSEFYILEQELSQIAKQLSLLPKVLTHRDYHSRNIMLKPAIISETTRQSSNLCDYEIKLIDFQDARSGPVQYDLVSLLEDCYYEISPENNQRLIQYYWEQFAALFYRQHFALNDSLNYDNFMASYDLQTFQRCYKAIGTFAYIYYKKNNPLYLIHIGRAMEKVRKVLSKYPQFAKLKEIILKYY